MSDSEMIKEGKIEELIAEKQMTSFDAGNLRAYNNMLMVIIKGMPDGNLRTIAALNHERNETILKLREICEHHGDNDWDNNANIVDVLEKHLYDHLENKE